MTQNPVNNNKIAVSFNYLVDQLRCVRFKLKTFTPYTIFG